jgi:hypothetical protein
VEGAGAAVSDDGEDAELVRLGDSEAIEEDAFGEGEDDGVGPDAEGKRGNGDEGEARTAAKHADGIAEISAKLVEKAEAERGADGLFVGFDLAELDAGATEGFGGSEAGALEVFGAEFDVDAELGVYRGLHGVAMKERVEVGAKLGLHGESSSRFLRA